MTHQLVERFDGTSRRAQRIFVVALLVMGGGLGLLIAAVPDDDVSGTVNMWLSISLAAPFAAASWMFSRMRLELQIDDDGFAARVRPFRRVRVDARSVVNAEIVEVAPFGEFGGWWDKGTRSNRLLGGAGCTALRVSYRLDTGAPEPRTCRLTILTTHHERLLAALGRVAAQAGRGP